MKKTLIVLLSGLLVVVWVALVLLPSGEPPPGVDSVTESVTAAQGSEVSFLNPGYLLALLLALTALSTAGNAVIRGSFACKYGKQRLVGCPAEQLFNKQQESEETPA